MKKLLFLGVAALVLSACSNEVEELQSSNVEYAKTVKAEIAPFIAEDGTRTTIIDDNGTWNTVWAAGDKMGIWPKTGLAAEQTPQQIQFTINEAQAGLASATFTGTGWGMVTNGQYSYYAYYPYSTSTTATTATFNYNDGLLQEVNGQPSSKLGKNDLCCAPAVMPANPEDASFMFKHLGTLVCFNLAIPDDAKDKEFFMLKVSADDKIFPTKVKYDPSTMTEEENPVITNVEYTNTLSMSLANIQADENGIVKVYFLVLPAAVQGKALSLELYSTDCVCKGTKTPSTDWMQSRYKTYNVTGLTTEPLENVVNLSASGTANCYIVNKKSTKYLFRADIKGNGVVPSGVDDVAETGVARADGAVVLWETVNTDIAPEAGTILKSASLIGSIIMIETPETFTAGNALVSLYKDTDKSGAYNKGDEILWSWHIWATDADIEAQSLGSVTMMDRNLGALSNGDMYMDGETVNFATPGLAMGFQYQWGRPFPIIGLCADASTMASKKVSMATINAGGATWGVDNNAVESNETTGSLAYSAKNPMTFIYASAAAVGSKSEGNWYYCGDADAPAFWGEAKTMYDPCPVGWKVPGRNGDAYTVWENNFTANNTVWSDACGRYLIGNDNVIFYPACGVRGANGTAQSGKIMGPCQSGSYWSSARPKTTYKVYLLNFSPSNINNKNAGVRAFGMNIRPCKE